MNLKVRESTCRLRGTLGAPKVSSTDSISTGFCSQKWWGLIFQALEPWGGVPGVDLGLLTPKISLHVDVGPIFIHMGLRLSQVGTGYQVLGD